MASTTPEDHFDHGQANNFLTTSNIYSGKFGGILRKNRFICIIQDPSKGLPKGQASKLTIEVNSVNIPKVSFTSKDTTIYGYPRRYIEEKEGSEFTITFYESAQLTLRKIFFDWMQAIYDQKSIKRNYLAAYESPRVIVGPLTWDLKLATADVFEYVFPIGINSLDYNIEEDNGYAKTEITFSYRFHTIQTMPLDNRSLEEFTGGSKKASNQTGSTEPSRSSDEDMQEGSGTKRSSVDSKPQSSSDENMEQDEADEDYDPDEYDEMEDEINNELDADEEELEDELNEDDEEIIDEEEEDLEEDLDEDDEDIAECDCQETYSEPKLVVIPPKPVRVPTEAETTAVYDEYDDVRNETEIIHSNEIDAIYDEYQTKIDTALTSGNTKLAATLARNRDSAIKAKDDKLLADKDSIFKAEQNALKDLTKV